MNIGDILRFTLRYTVLQQLCLNVFYYEVASTNVSTSLDEALDAFELVFQSSLETIMSDQASFDQLDVENVTDGVSFASRVLLWNGTNSGAPLSAFYAAGVRLNRATKTTRNGYKRISGITEGDVDGGSYTSGYLADLDAFAVDCAADIAETPNTDLVALTPVIVGFNTDGTIRAVNTISSASSYGPTTQNSRKPDFSV